MKHNLKRILPILLAILTVGSILWYLFVYDRDFTRDMLVDQARYFEDRGQHSIAAWLYRQAYNQSNADDDVAIELAEQFISVGNFTKAEYTLTNAIADGGSTELYIALCSTYVRQGKLWDAVNMLNNVADPEVRAQLNAMRPATPTTSHEPDTYNQYITVTLSAESGTLYFTSNGDYPSTNVQHESSEVTLVGGINILQAIAVGDNGLVSPLATFRYTIGGVIEQIVLSDSAMDALVRKQLMLGANEEIFTDDLWTFTTLTLPETVTSSADLAYFTQLKSLSASNSTIDGWESLAKLTQLTELTLHNCTLSTKDLQAIASLPYLEKLTLSSCNLSSISGLNGAKLLRYLNLKDNTIRDLMPLTGMTQLETLDISHNAVDNLSALSALSSLTTLDASYNSLISLVPLSTCPQLMTLNVSTNAISSLSGVENLTKLQKLDLSTNALTDVSALANCAALKDLNLSANSLSDIGILANITGLEQLSFSHNAVSALPAFSKDCTLVSITGDHNKLTSVAQLVGLSNLNTVVLDYNSISNVNSLADCPKLISVSVFGNPVSDVSALKARSIIVTYTPKT